MWVFCDFRIVIFVLSLPLLCCMQYHLISEHTITGSIYIMICWCLVIFKLLGTTTGTNCLCGNFICLGQRRRESGNVQMSDIYCPPPPPPPHPPPPHPHPHPLPPHPPPPTPPTPESGNVQMSDIYCPPPPPHPPPTPPPPHPPTPPPPPPHPPPPHPLPTNVSCPLSISWRWYLFSKEFRKTPHCSCTMITIMLYFTGVICLW